MGLFSKCDQIPRNMRIWTHLPKKSLMENFVSCTVNKTNKRADAFVVKADEGQA